MSICRVMRILPATRRYNPCLYRTAPSRTYNPPLAVRTVYSNPVPDKIVIRNGIVVGRTYYNPPTAPATASPARPCLAYHGPRAPIVLLPFNPYPSNLFRHYVYHPTALFIGPYVVRTESGKRVVYMTTEQARFYRAAWLIGNIDWVLLPWASRKIIMQCTGGAVIADFAPIVNTPLVDQNGTEETPLTPYQFSATAFWDPDDHSQTLTYTATLSSGAALPEWLTFTPSTRTFSGTPANNSAGDFTIRVRATDPWGRSVTDDFTLTIAP